MEFQENDSIDDPDFIPGTSDEDDDIIPGTSHEKRDAPFLMVKTIAYFKTNVTIIFKTI